ncbi:DUF1150 family protein [Ferrovibrio terrae]|uniref:DUF1150 family protein n=1 Tax=Ferrovibrio terrae TaxID=2594003 RepID=A0A516H2S2_9PROT|nr:DUF1150 family protein [Ferrovibrio terrae]QDO98081.1 DUF1150 family protein [Ferrovibrio terrae]
MATPNNQDRKSDELQTQPLMTEESFANLGAPDLAYIRPVQTPEGLAWGIYAANGTQLGFAPERDLAFAAAVQNDLLPVSVQ